MSASILYERVKPGRSLGVGAPQAFLEAMREAFGGDGPWVLADRDDAVVLRGMAAANPSLRDAFERLRSALDNAPDGIRVWAEY